MASSRRGTYPSGPRYLPSRGSMHPPHPPLCRGPLKHGFYWVLLRPFATIGRRWLDGFGWSQGFCNRGRGEGPFSRATFSAVGTSRPQLKAPSTKQVPPNSGCGFGFGFAFGYLRERASPESGQRRNHVARIGNSVNLHGPSLKLKSLPFSPASTSLCLVLSQLSPSRRPSRRPSSRLVLPACPSLHRMANYRGWLC